MSVDLEQRVFRAIEVGQGIELGGFGQFAIEIERPPYRQVSAFGKHI